MWSVSIRHKILTHTQVETNPPVSYQKTGFSLLPVGFCSAEGLSSHLFSSTPPPASSARCNIQQSRLHLSNSIPGAVAGEDHSSRTPPYFPSGDLSEGTRKRLRCRLKMARGLRGTPTGGGTELKRRGRQAERRSSILPVIHCFLLRHFPSALHAPSAVEPH